VNLTGTFLVTRAALPALLDGGGSIVNVASTAGLIGSAYSAAYCASKGGVVLGPVTSSYSMIDKLVHAGMDVARLNFSHGTYEDRVRMVAALRRASAPELLGPCTLRFAPAVDYSPFDTWLSRLPADCSALCFVCPYAARRFDSALNT